MHKVLLVLLTFLFILTTGGCGNPALSESPAQAEWVKIKETESFVYYGTSKDANVIEEIDKTLSENYPSICRILNYEFDEKITVEVYADQTSYDASLTDKSVEGSPACSGQRTIKIVSPDSPIKVSGIKYEERLMMAVHELVHLMADEINNDMPIWMDEGLASFLGFSDGYIHFCEYAFPQLPEINFTEMEDSYYSLSAPDVYSASAVRYIAEHYGYDKLNQLIREPERFEDILSVTKHEFSERWNDYIRSNFK